MFAFQINSPCRSFITKALRKFSVDKPHKLQFVYIVGWDFSPTFLVVWFDNKCWTKVQHSDSIPPPTNSFIDRKVIKNHSSHDMNSSKINQMHP